MQQEKKAAELEEIKALEEEKVIKQTEELEKEIEIETQEVEFETEEILEKKKRREAIFEMALFLILGILLGITIKTEAVKRITIGFNDYQISKSAARYDIAEIKKGLDAQMAQEQAAQQAAEPQMQPQKAN